MNDVVAALAGDDTHALCENDYVLVKVGTTNVRVTVVEGAARVRVSVEEVADE